jgi:hypothetical protein
MLKYASRSLTAFGLIAACAGLAQAGSITYDVTNDFSVTNGNPNGVWTYGWRNGTTFTPYTDAQSNPGTSILWRGDIGGDGTPMIWKNLSGSTSYGVQPGQVSLHPSPFGDASIARWTDPGGIGSSITINGQFFAGDSGVMDVAIVKNGDWSNLLWSAVDAGAFSLSTTVAAGDTIDFAVYGSYAYGNTPLDARIQATTFGATAPEPATLALAFVGAGLAVGRKALLRRRGR